MCDAGSDDARFLPQALAGRPQFTPRLGEVGTADVPQLDVLEMAPDAFFGIQLRRVARKALEVDPRGRPLPEKLLDDPAAVDGGAVPNDEQLAPDVPEQMPEEANDLAARDRVVVDLKVELRGEPDGADDREVVVREPMVQERRLADGCVGAGDGRQQVEAALVDEQQRAVLTQGLIF